MRDAWIALGRFMAVGLFFASGLSKITDYSSNLALMTQNGVPTFFLPLVVLLEVAGSVAVAIGFLTRFTSAFMAVFSVISAFLFYQGYTHPHMMVWLKNICCSAAFLFLILNGTGKWSVDYFIKNRIPRNAWSNYLLG